MSTLRLGPIIEDKPVKVTIDLPGALHRRLGDYAAAHAKETGLLEPLAPERLIIPMIERFMETDRGFAKYRSQR